MKTIREILNNKPSAALEAMVAGLREQSENPDFVIDMGTYGNNMPSSDFWKHNVKAPAGKKCFGCAATCAIQNIAKKNLRVTNIWDLGERADQLGFEPKDLYDFEYAIDTFRTGRKAALVDYFDLDGLPLVDFCAVWLDWQEQNPMFCMDTSNWRSQIPYVERLIVALKEKGL